MPVFKYRGYNQHGTAAQGVIEADGPKDAALKIKSKGIFPKRNIRSSFLPEEYIIQKTLSPGPRKYYKASLHITVFRCSAS